MSKAPGKRGAAGPLGRTASYPVSIVALLPWIPDVAHIILAESC